MHWLSKLVAFILLHGLRLCLGNVKFRVKPTQGEHSMVTTTEVNFRVRSKIHCAILCEQESCTTMDFNSDNKDCTIDVPSSPLNSSETTDGFTFKYYYDRTSKLKTLEDFCFGLYMPRVHVHGVEDINLNMHKTHNF